MHICTCTNERIKNALRDTKVTANAPTRDKTHDSTNWTIESWKRKQ